VRILQEIRCMRFPTSEEFSGINIVRDVQKVRVKRGSRFRPHISSPNQREDLD
jgi:hypothetical protein